VCLARLWGRHTTLWRVPRVELLALLEATHKDIAFTVVVGQDLVAALPTWASADTVRRSARLLVLPRLGGSAPVDSGVEVLAHPDAGAAVQSTAASSTEVRRRLAHHQRCDGLLPVRV
jgi:nicotinic acid mononucleotide adenylyltransferase